MGLSNNYRFRRQMAAVVGISALLAGGTLPAGAQSAAAVSQDYSMEYSTTAASGGSVTAADYKVVSRVQLNGVTGQVISSDGYSISPLIGGAPTPVSSSVGNWTLY